LLGKLSAEIDADHKGSADIAAKFASLRRQSDPEINLRLLASADRMIDAAPESPESWKTKAAIECRLGRFDAARDSYQYYLALIGRPWQADMSAGIVTPPDFYNRAEFQLPTLAVLDDFLSTTQMEGLLADAISAAPLMRDAAISASERDVLDFTKRRTSVVKKFTAGSDLLQHAVEAKLERLRRSFHIAPFKIGKHSIKLTYHGDGGFFFPHRDSDEILKPESRVMTWLYYFGKTPRKYLGGDLFLFETDTQRGRYATPSFIKVEPLSNRLVIFPSWFFHAVSPLEMFPDASFADGRFAISGHVHVHKNA